MRRYFYVAAASLIGAGCISIPERIPIDGDGGTADAADGDGQQANARKRRIVITPVSPIAANLGRTAIAIRLTDDSDFMTHAENDGSDLLVTDDDGDSLPHEIEHIDKAAGNLVLWVGLTSFSRTGETFDLYYGGERSDENVPALVFEDAALVWHFGDFDVDTGQVKDSGGTTPGAPALVLAPGAFGPGGALTGASVSSAANPPIYPLSGEYTLSMFVNLGQNAGNLIEFGDVGSDVFGLRLHYADVATGWRFTSLVNSTTGQVSSLRAIGTGSWLHLSIHVERGGLPMPNIVGRVNGAEDTSSHPWGLGSYSEQDPLVLGTGVSGTIDEVRIYRRNRSADELSIERQNALTPEFIDVGLAAAASYP